MKKIQKSKIDQIMEWIKSKMIFYFEIRFPPFGIYCVLFRFLFIHIACSWTWICALFCSSVVCFLCMRRTPDSLWKCHRAGILRTTSLLRTTCMRSWRPSRLAVWRQHKPNPTLVVLHVSCEDDMRLEVHLLALLRCRFWNGNFKWKTWWRILTRCPFDSGYVGCSPHKKENGIPNLYFQNRVYSQGARSLGRVGGVRAYLTLSFTSLIGCSPPT
jgi:hypothetical protein